MAKATTDDGVGLYYEETGSGAPIVFVHEFAGDLRSFEPQVRYFSRRYRCILYNARGYPPSDIPADVESYSQERARDDIRSVLDALKIDKAHIVGVSMGGFAVLHFGFAYPGRALSLVVAGCGYGAEPASASNLRTRRCAPRLRSPTGAWRKSRRLLALGRAVYSTGTRTRAATPSFLSGWRSIRPGLGQHEARRAGPSVVVVGPRRQDEGARRADADRDRR